jgi:dihydrofolate reductase
MGAGGTTLIVARDRNGAIGRGNAMPWHLPDDLKRFKALTLGQVVLMGRKTAEAIGRALPGRINLVLTRSSCVPFETQIAVESLAAARARLRDGQRLFVIGGGEVYRLALSSADTLEITEVETGVDGADAWFPAIDESAWEETELQFHPADARHAHAFRFRTLHRKRSSTPPHVAK